MFAARTSGAGRRPLIAAARGSIAVLAAFASAALFAQERTITPAPAFSGQALAQLPARDWPTNGGNLFNQRHSPLEEINRSNVSGLRGVWRAHLDGSGAGPKYSGEAQPIAYNGVLYVSTGANDVFAIDVDTGEQLWKYQAFLDQTIATVCCGWTSRGVGLGDGKVFVGQLDGQLKALDQRTGEVVWAIQAEPWEDGYTITSAPLYYDGLVITGFAGGERATRGRVKAFDATSGDLVWTFYTVPGPGEFGHDSWPADNDSWQIGGASVWQTPAVDPELGLIYFSTGNAGPDYNGSARAGDNLFTASIVALDVATGEYRWHFQQVHHDLWDFDSPNPVVLFDLEIDGRPRLGLAQASKTGWVYILDRTNGEPLIGIEEQAVPQEPRQNTSPTQPVPVGDSFVPQHIDIAPEGYTLVNEGRIFTPFWTDSPVLLKPSIGGGANWPPSAYDPRTGYLYVCARDSMSSYRAEALPDELPPAGTDHWGGVFTFTRMQDLGVLAAMDMRSNTIVWQQQWADYCLSGALSTAGDLVFVGRNDGRLTALDSATGALLWEFQTGAGMNAPVTSFEHDGKQYIAAYSAGNALAGTAKGDSLWLFGLDGELGPVPPAVTVLTDRREAVGPVDIGNGATVYANACVFCHGDDGAGGHGGGSSLLAVEDADLIIGVLNTGRGNMPAFSGALSPEQIRDVSHYVIESLNNE